MVARIPVLFELRGSTLGDFQQFLHHYSIASAYLVLPVDVGALLAGGDAHFGAAVVDGAPDLLELA